MLDRLLNLAIQGKALSQADLAVVFTKFFDDSMHPAKIAAYLTAWRAHGEYTDLLVAGAKFLRSNTKEEWRKGVEHLAPFYDNCGTGGSGQLKYNISTTAALLAASCGLKVAKHGNRAQSGRCGSADLLQALGYPLDLTPEKVVTLLKETGFSFFFAPSFHPLMAKVGELRRGMGCRTVFNILGPLANPLFPQGQIIGVAEHRLLTPVAEALAQLGTRRALVIHAENGLDELTIDHSNYIVRVENGQVEAPTVLNAKDLGLNSPFSPLKVGDANEAAKIFYSIIDNQPSAHRDASVLNAAALLSISELNLDLTSGIRLVQDRLNSGEVKRYFEYWIQQAKDLK